MRYKPSKEIKQIQHLQKVEIKCVLNQAVILENLLTRPQKNVFTSDAVKMQRLKNIHYCNTFHAHTFHFIIKVLHGQSLHI